MHAIPMQKKVPLNLVEFIPKYVLRIVSSGIWNPLLALMVKEAFYPFRKTWKESHSTMEQHKLSMYKIPG